MIRLSSASNLSQLKGRLILWKLNNSRWKNSIASVFIAVLETFLIYNDLTTKEFWYILMLTVPIERTNMPKRLDDTVSVSFFWIATTLTEIYQISVIHTTNLLEENHMSSQAICSCIPDNHDQFCFGTHRINRWRMGLCRFETEGEFEAWSTMVDRRKSCQHLEFLTNRKNWRFRRAEW